MGYIFFIALINRNRLVDIVDDDAAAAALCVVVLFFLFLIALLHEFH